MNKQLLQKLESQFYRKEHSQNSDYAISLMKSSLLALDDTNNKLGWTGNVNDNTKYKRVLFLNFVGEPATLKNLLLDDDDYSELIYDRHRSKNNEEFKALFKTFEQLVYCYDSIVSEYGKENGLEILIDAIENTKEINVNSNLKAEILKLSDAYSKKLTNTSMHCGNISKIPAAKKILFHLDLPELAHKCKDFFEFAKMNSEKFDYYYSFKSSPYAPADDNCRIGILRHKDKVACFEYSSFSEEPTIKLLDSNDNESIFFGEFELDDIKNDLNRLPEIVLKNENTDYAEYFFSEHLLKPEQIDDDLRAIYTSISLRNTEYNGNEIHRIANILITGDGEPSFLLVDMEQDNHSKNLIIEKDGNVIYIDLQQNKIQRYSEGDEFNLLGIDGIAESGALLSIEIQLYGSYTIQSSHADMDDSEPEIKTKRKLKP